MRVIKTATLAAVWIALLCGGAWAESSTKDSEKVPQSAQEELKEILAFCKGNPRCRVKKLTEVALLERPGGEIEKLAGETLLRYANRDLAKSLISAFSQGGAYAKIQALQIFHEYWTEMGLASSPRMAEICRMAMDEPDERVHWYAAKFLADRPLIKAGAVAADLATLYPELTLPALMSIEISKDHRMVRWTLDFLDHEDPLVRQAAQRVIALFDRQAAAPLRAWADSPDAARRRLGIENLVLIATPDEAPALHRWLERYGSEEEDLRGLVIKTLANLEVGLHRPKIPPRATFEIPERFRVEPLGPYYHP